MVFSSKVGAMPQTKPKKQAKQRHNQPAPASGKFRSTPKGITIEDLKRQTARRLAQELNQGATPSTNGGVKEVGTRDRGSTRSNAVESNRHSRPNNDIQVHYSHTNGSVSVSSNSKSNSNSINNGGNESFNYNGRGPQRYDPTIPNQSRWMPRTNIQSVPSPRHGPPPPSQPIGMVNSYPTNKPIRYVRTTAGTQYINQVPVHPSEKGKKSKLPHGLTVQELKEMTKARLQAEAAERCDNSAGSYEQGRRFSPIAFDGPTQDNRREDSVVNEIYGQLQGGVAQQHSFSNPLMEVPSSVQVSPSSRQQPSPLPHGYHGSTGISKPHFVDVAQENHLSWSQQSKMEAWDNASAASNYSEFSDYVSQGDDNGSTQFIRTRSNTAPGPVNLPMEFNKRPPSSSPVAPGFDAAIGFNRRRALTSSPRTNTVHLTQAGNGLDGLQVPAYSSPLQPGQFPSRSFDNVPPVFQQGAVNNHSIGNSSKIGIWGEIMEPANCDRTSSTTSLPPISNSAQEFSSDRVSLSQIGRHRSLSGVDGSPPPHMNSQGHFGSFPMESKRDSPPVAGDTASVFRAIAPFDGEADGLNRSPPVNNGGPGLNNSSSQLGNPMFSRVSSMESVSETVATSVWADISKAANPTLRAADLDANIASNLGSILKLSGATERHEPDRTDARSQSGFGSVPSLF